MNFAEHIGKIDRRVEAMKNNEYKMTLFGQGAEISGAAAGFTGQRIGQIQSNGFGGWNTFQNGVRTGSIQKRPGGGFDKYNSSGVRVSHTIPNVLGGYDEYDG